VKEVIPKENEQINSVPDVSKEVDFLMSNNIVLYKKISEVSYLTKWIAQGIIINNINYF